MKRSKKAARKRRASERESSSEPDFPSNVDRTDYAKSRPVRESAKLKGEMITFSGNYKYVYIF